MNGPLKCLIFYRALWKRRYMIDKLPNNHCLSVLWMNSKSKDTSLLMIWRNYTSSIQHCPLKTKMKFLVMQYRKLVIQLHKKKKPFWIKSAYIPMQFRLWATWDPAPSPWGFQCTHFFMTPIEWAIRQGVSSSRKVLPRVSSEGFRDLLKPRIPEPDVTYLCHACTPLPQRPSAANSY